MSTGAGPGDVEWIGMIGNEDWLMRPVLGGLCKYESLIDGTLSLEDVALMNEALDVQAENRYRLDQRNKHVR